MEIHEQVSGRTVGLIGVGLLGGAIAERLLGAGFRVVGYDIDAKRTEAFAEMGNSAILTVFDKP